MHGNTKLKKKKLHIVSLINFWEDRAVEAAIRTSPAVTLELALLC